MTELKQRVILVPIILQIMSSPTFIKQESLPYTLLLFSYCRGLWCSRSDFFLCPQQVLASPSCRFWPCSQLRAAVGLVSECSSSLTSLDMKDWRLWFQASEHASTLSTHVCSELGPPSGARQMLSAGLLCFLLHRTAEFWRSDLLIKRLWFLCDCLFLFHLLVKRQILVQNHVLDEWVQRCKTALVLSFPLAWCVLLHTLRLVIKASYNEWPY